MVWTMLWMILLHHVMNDAMNDPIKWWYERCYERSYYMLLWTMLGMILLDDAMNDSVEIPKWIQLRTFPTLLDDAMNYARTMQERCWANTKEYNYGFTLHGMMLWTMLERCSNDAGQIPKNTITHFHTAWNDAMNDSRMMLEWCSNDAGQIPKNTITHCHTAWERCLWTDAWTMLGRSRNNAGQIPKNTITNFHTVWNDAGIMLKQSWANPKWLQLMHTKATYTLKRMEGCTSDSLK